MGTTAAGRRLLFRFAVSFSLLLPAMPAGAVDPPDATSPHEATGSDDGRAADYDPLEKINRPIFWFNDHADEYVLEPVARGWDWVVPDPVETSISNFFSNLRFPVVMLNNLLQGKLEPAAIDVGRFMVNTTFGVAGFFDPASDWGLTRHNEDFGQTLGWYGVPPGPYLVIPLLGPSNPRDTGGMVVDYVLSIYPWLVDSYALFGVTAVNVINARAQILEEVRDAKQTSLDYYVFVRNAYYQRRDALVNDLQEVKGQPATEDLYDLNGINDAR